MARASSPYSGSLSRRSPSRGGSVSASDPHRGMCFRVRALAPTHRHGRAHPLPAPLPPSSALLPQALCYGADTLLFVTLHATDIDAHLSAAVIGALIIIAPTLMQHIAGRHVQGRRNAGRGMQVALLLGFLWLVMVVTLHSLKFPIGPALQLCSGYTIACLVVACLAIYRFLCTLLLVYAIYTSAPPSAPSCSSTPTTSKSAPCSPSLG